MYNAIPGIFCMNLIYIIGKQIYLNGLAFDCDLSTGLINELSMWHYVSTFKFPVLKLFKVLDFQIKDA